MSSAIVPSTSASSAVFYAYEIHDPAGMTLRTAPIDRAWMDAAHQRHPYRCLPLVIANQSGWIIENPVDFRVYWYGGERPQDMEVAFDAGGPDPRITSHFGNAVLTFSVPYLFRTPPGYNLWVKGPANWIRDAVQALEGVVETDWSSATFTMNWKVTRPNTWISFRRGEPICMLVPIQRGLLESLQTFQLPLTENDKLHAEYLQWESKRSGFLQGLKEHDPETVKQGWQKEYFQGRQPEGGRFAGHQTHLALNEFARPPRTPPPESTT